MSVRYASVRITAEKAKELAHALSNLMFDTVDVVLSDTGLITLEEDGVIESVTGVVMSYDDSDEANAFAKH